MDFLEETDGQFAMRSLELFIENVLREYGAIHEVLRMDKLQEIIAFKRKQEWDVRRYWRMLKTLQLSEKQVGSALREEIAFTHTLSALGLHANQRRTISPHFESTGKVKNLANLQDITVRLFGAYSFVGSPTVTFRSDQVEIRVKLAIPQSRKRSF